MRKAKWVIYTKEFIRYLIVWIFFAIAIILSIWVNIPSCYVMCNFSNEVCSAINNVILTISLSYIAGTFFFLLSVLIPNAKNKYDDEYRIAFCLDKLKKDYLSVINFTDNGENFQKPSFVELSNTLFVEDVTDYCKDLELTNKNGECDIVVHFKPEIMLELELNANILREDLSLLRMLSPKLSFQIIKVLSKVNNSRLLTEIGNRKGYRGNFAYPELEIRLVLYKLMMRDYREIEIELTNEINNNNKLFPKF